MKPLTAREAAALLGISVRAVYDLAAPAGPVPCLRFGRAVRFEHKDIKSYRDGLRLKAQPQSAPYDEDLAEIASRAVALPLCAGVYFLFLSGRLVYIGRAVNIARRLGQHTADKAFDAYSFIACHPSEMAALEAQCILRFRPTLNKQLRPAIFVDEIDPADEITIEGGDMREQRC
jgi:excisionase family DNA binding protein